MNIKFKEINSDKILAKQLFEKADDEFNYYLGYENGVESAIEEVTNADDKHKYWIIYNNNEIIGLMYIYDYKEQYHKCSLGYGLLPEYRGKNISSNIINQFCNWLETNMNIIRIQADIELTNKSCLLFMKKHMTDIGFKYECTASNYWGQGINCNIYSRCKYNEKEQ